MTDTIESLAARVSFLESWIQVPIIHLPGYVAPVSIETPVTPELVPVEPTTDPSAAHQTASE